MKRVSSYLSNARSPLEMTRAERSDDGTNLNDDDNVPTSQSKTVGGVSYDSRTLQGNMHTCKCDRGAGRCQGLVGVFTCYTKTRNPGALLNQ
jgi:hypothetical protein